MTDLDERGYGPTGDIEAQGGLTYNLDVMYPDWDESEMTMQELGELWLEFKEMGRKRNPKKTRVRKLLDNLNPTDVFCVTRGLTHRNFCHPGINLSLSNDTVYRALGELFGDGSVESGKFLTREHGTTTEGFRAVQQSELDYPDDAELQPVTLGELFGKWLYAIAETNGEYNRADLLVEMLKRTETPWVLAECVFHNISLYWGSANMSKVIGQHYDIENHSTARRLFGSSAQVALAAECGDIRFDIRPHDNHSVMKANSISAADVSELDHQNWLAQTKYDGARLFVHHAGDGDVRAYSSGMRDVTAALPELEAVDWPDPPFIFDAEATPYNEDGEPIPFENVMTRLTRESDSIDPDDFDTDVVFKFFDCVHWHGRDISDRKYTNRFSIVENVFPPDLVARTGDDLENTFQTAVENGHEGVVLKRKDSTYVPGGRHSRWRKWKQEPETIEAQVVGVESGSGRISDRMGALKLGLKDPTDEITKVGRVGTGFSDEQRLEWWKDYEAGDAIGSVIEIAYEDLQYAGGNWGLRFPRYKRRRPDGEVDSVERAARLIGRDDDIEGWLG